MLGLTLIIGCWFRDAKALIRAYAAAELGRENQKRGKHLRDISEKQRRPPYAPRSCDTRSSSSAASWGEKKGRRPRGCPVRPRSDLQRAFGDLNDISARNIRDSGCKCQRGQASQQSAIYSWCYLRIPGRSDGRSVKAAEKAHAEFSHVKTFWNILNRSSEASTERRGDRGLRKPSESNRLRM